VGTIQEILKRIAECDAYMKKHRDPRTGEGPWQVAYEVRGRCVCELKRRAEHEGDTKARAAWKKVAK
jgi:hypothetical protein